MKFLRYHKEGREKYLVMSCENPVYIGYRGNVLRYHKIPYFLTYEIRQINENYEIYYHLRYATPLSALNKHQSGNYEFVKTMLDSIIGVLESAREYLLLEEHIVWSMDYIYVEPETGKLAFCYNPEEQGNTESFEDFIGSFIPFVGKQDDKTVKLVLAFYNTVMQPDINLEKLLWFRNNKLLYETQDSVEEITEDEMEESYMLNYLKKEYDGKPECVISKITEAQKGIQEKDRADTFSNGDLFLIGMAAICILLTAGLFVGIIPTKFLYALPVLILILIAGTIYLIYINKSPEPETEHTDNSIDRTPVVFFEKEEPVKENIYGETVLLMEDFPVNSETVVETTSKKLCLIPMYQNQYDKLYIRRDNVVVGCMEDTCDYTLKSKGVSRMHAKIRSNEQNLFIMDLNSTNGTFLNGNRMESGKEYALESGDSVTFANVEFFVAEE